MGSRGHLEVGCRGQRCSETTPSDSLNSAATGPQRQHHVIPSVTAEEAAAQRGGMSWPRSNQDLNLGWLYVMTFQFSSCLFYLLDACQKQGQAKQPGFRGEKPTGVTAQKVRGAMRGRVPDLDFAEGNAFPQRLLSDDPESSREGLKPTGTMGEAHGPGDTSAWPQSRT